jgi:hypothetical protein
MPRRANYWYAFLCASLMLLRRGGNISFVLPSAWDYADYATPLRDLAPTLFRQFDVHRSERPLFKSVLDGCVVIVGRGYGLTQQVSRRFSYNSIEDLVSGLRSTNSRVAGRCIHSKRLVSRPAGKQRFVEDLIDIRLGGVTGDADYFLLSEKRRQELDLPLDALRPALSRARHLVAAEISHDTWQMLRETGERIWLFDPSEESFEHPAVQRYLELEEKDGGCRRGRYKIKSREPWYRTRLPESVDGFLSGMARSGPWLSFSTMPMLTATNTLYTFRFKVDLNMEEKATWALALLHGCTNNAERPVARRYADGLVKYEPGDIYRIPLTAGRGIKGAWQRYREAVDEMLRDKRGFAAVSVNR